MPETKEQKEMPLSPSRIVVGIETEFGIIRKDLEESDPVRESMDLVRAYRPHSFGAWAYEAEDPRADARGFRVDRLAQDEEEDAFSRSDQQRHFSFRESKSDRILQNGARFYNDHTHPEYSTPECRTLRDLILYDRAGTEILRQAVKTREEELARPGAIGLYRNNTDFHGHSYGCHENYLLPRSLPFSSLVAGVTPFLVARTLLLGAGKVGREGEDGLSREGYQLSQRADFIEERIGVNTMHQRPIVNSRDEPHADRTLFRRLHLICGDANMSEWQTAMKVGMTRLVLSAVATLPCEKFPVLSDPVRAFRRVSRAENGNLPLELEGGKTITPREILLAYRDLCSGLQLDSEDKWVLSEWGRALEDYEKDPELLADRVDWVAKRQLLDLFRSEEGLSSGDPWLQSLDLAYHDLDQELGMFWPLESDGRMIRLTDPGEVDAATIVPPRTGRAPVRAAVLRRYEKEIRDAGWERIAFVDGSHIDLPLFMELERGDVETLCRRIASCEERADLAKILQRIERGG